MRKDLNQVKLILNKNLDFLRNNYQVNSIGIFGSVARAEEFTNDIDLLIEFSQPIGMFKFIDLENFLAQLLDSKVDLVTKKALKPRIKEEILKEVVYV